MLKEQIGLVQTLLVIKKKKKFTQFKNFKAINPLLILHSFF